GPPAEDVQDLEEVIGTERQGAGLEQEQDERTGDAQETQAVDKRLSARIDQVDDRGHQQGRQQLSGEEAPLWKVAAGLDQGADAEQRQNGRRHGIVHISAVSEPAPTKIASASGMPAQARARTSPGTITAAVVIAAARVKKRTSSSSISAANAATTAATYASLTLNRS